MKEKIIKLIREIFRHHISLLMLITLIDLALLAADESVTLCFGLLAPQRLLALGLAGHSLAGETSLIVCGWLTAIICIGLFAVCLASSYSRPGWLLCAAVMTLLDTALAVISLVAHSDSTYYLDIAAHAWCIAALVIAYILARRKPAQSPSQLPDTGAATITNTAESLHNIDDPRAIKAPEEAQAVAGYESSAGAQQPYRSDDQKDTEAPTE